MQDIIYEHIKSEGENVNLNDIDVSNITDMSCLFDGTNFNGNISEWDVSNVTNMSSMFFKCEAFNQDISSWDVSNVTDISKMFVGDVTHLIKIYLLGMFLMLQICLGCFINKVL